ncbi:MAG: STN domain-containing protein [Butyricimonas faecihominis]
MKQASYSQWATKVCMLLGCLILFSFSGFGGGTSPKFDEKTPLNLKFEKATMLQVLNTLKKETSLDFVYNHEEIQGIPLITKEFKNVTVREILDYCLQNTLTYACE